MYVNGSALQLFTELYNVHTPLALGMQIYNCSYIISRPTATR